jgi:hypothetical protein
MIYYEVFQRRSRICNATGVASFLRADSIDLSTLRSTEVSLRAARQQMGLVQFPPGEVQRFAPAPDEHPLGKPQLDPRRFHRHLELAAILDPVLVRAGLPPALGPRRRSTVLAAPERARLADH